MITNQIKWKPLAVQYNYRIHMQVIEKEYVSNVAEANATFVI